MSTPLLDPAGNPISQEDLLGYGRSGVVVLQDGMAVKMPLRYLDSTDDDVAINTTVIQREQEAYQRLKECDGAVPYISFSQTTTQLALMKNGDLRSYLSRNQPSKALQLSWFRQMAHALCDIHGRSVIVADIACRNLLLDSTLAIKFCDFTESTIMPPDTDMETADDNGYSIQTDIGQLGKVIYEVVSGEHCEFDLHENDVSRATLPRRETLPSTEEIWLGPIIEKCWTWNGYKNAAHLAEALDAVS
ncbi:kinase-like protein [Aspergillus novofumigatus IBT 16806]|uniref:Kinase-like protein n=1 Tax=Aspergillus novofumigatus (strain IBT 16806) TaxID=1392255 RepID=A0A2I1BUK9_ASPN1|nr:kinase-like protein [Aspergillus novofumigatus IBT 16806]PKX89059.1 kinase-like protein [Aspergillus novofumigatus IBT 16806]